MIVRDTNRQVLGEYADIFIRPTLAQEVQAPLHIPIHLDGANSPVIGELLIEPNRAALQEYTINGPRVIQVYKPGKPDASRNTPSYSFVRALQERIDEHIESQGRYREKGQGILDIPYSEVPTSESTGYIKHDEDIPPHLRQSRFSAVSADSSGIYLVGEQPGVVYEASHTGIDLAELEELQTRVITHIFETKLEEELYKIELVKITEGVVGSVVNRVLSDELRNIRLHPYVFGFAQTGATYREDGTLDVEVKVFGYTGDSLRGATGKQDADYIKGRIDG